MAYNEARSLEATCVEILETVAAIGVPTELLIVNDGSTDGTLELAEGIAARHKQARVIHHPLNRGLGGVYRTGFSEAHGDLVTFFPADGQFPATIIREFLLHIEDRDLVLGFLPRREGSIMPRLLSVSERTLYTVLFGGLPKFQGVLMFRRALLDRYDLRSEGRGWTILMEFVLRCSRDGCRLISVPTDVRARAFGSSKVNNLRTIGSHLRQILDLWRVLGWRPARSHRSASAASASRTETR
jgi:glycosyltransferase involved in cell wall biosynthesis